MADKDLAEFVIHLALESDGVSAFKAALASNGAIFPSAFAERLHEMVQRRFLRSIAPLSHKYAIAFVHALCLGATFKTQARGHGAASQASPCW
jgi:hypothetical protein